MYAAPIEITGTATTPRRNINLCPASAVWINLSACTTTFSEVSSPIPAFISNPCPVGFLLPSSRKEASLKLYSLFLQIDSCGFLHR